MSARKENFFDFKKSIVTAKVESPITRPNIVSARCSRGIRNAPQISSAYDIIGVGSYIH